MTTEANKAIARQLLHGINSDDEATFLAVLAPDIVRLDSGQRFAP